MTLSQLRDEIELWRRDAADKSKRSVRETAAKWQGRTDAYRRVRDFIEEQIAESLTK